MELIERLTLQDFIVILVFISLIIGAIINIVKKISSFFNKKDHKAKSSSIDVEQSFKQPHISTKKEKIDAYSTLFYLLIRDFTTRRNLIEQLEKIIQYNEDDWDILYGLNDFVMETNIDVLIYLDYKSEIEELEYQINSILKVNYPYYNIELPPASNYNEEACVSDYGVFDDYSYALRKGGLQLGFIDTDGDDYMIIVHKTQDRNTIDRLITTVGFDYYETIK